MSPESRAEYLAAIAGRHDADDPPFDASAFLDEHREEIVAETQRLLTAEKDPGDLDVIIQCRQRALAAVLDRYLNAGDVAAVENASGTISATPARDADCITADFQI